MKEKTRKKLIIVIIGFAVIGCVIFACTVYAYFIHSHVKLNSDIDKEYFGIFGEFIGGVVGTIFSIITAILVYLTYTAQQKKVIETKKLLHKQIDLSIKPDLYFSNVAVYGFANGQEDDTGDYATHFSNLVSMSVNEIHNNVNVDLINVGVGIAKNIEFYWEFDLCQIDTYLNKHFENNPLTMNSIAENFVEFKMPGLKDSMYMGQSFYKVVRRFDILQSFNQGARKINIPFPMPYLMTYFIAIKLCLANRMDILNSFMALEDFPKCILNISYSDISEKSHKKVFQFKFSGHGSFSLKGQKEVPMFSYDIYANEI